jgi:CDP-alcohol phosphatidyltransferase
MAAQAAQPASTLEATYKLEEAEGILDLYFYRKIGFFFAKFFEKLGAPPVAVTLLGGLFGIVAGHLYYYRDLRTNVVGMALHVLANALDNADGQLARMTGRGSREGRIMDSLIDHLIFVNIYLHLTLRCLAEGASTAICMLAVAAAISHALQGAAADYFRSGFLYFVHGRSRSQLDSAAALQNDYRALTWRRQAWKKFLLVTYLSFTRQQEMIAPQLLRFRGAIDRQFPDEIPAWLRARYRDWARPMFKWWGFLMTNTRMIVLFLFLLIGQPVWFFWIELTILNAVLIGLLFRQSRMLQVLLRAATISINPAPAGC